MTVDDHIRWMGEHTMPQNKKRKVKASRLPESRPLLELATIVSAMRRKRAAGAKGSKQTTRWMSWL